MLSSQNEMKKREIYSIMVTNEKTRVFEVYCFSKHEKGHL